MTTMTLPADVDAALEQLDEENETAYRQLVLDLADGEPVDATAVRATLQAAGRTVDDLRRHQRIAADRRAALDDIVTAEALAASLDDLRAKRDAANEAVRAMREKHRAELAPLLKSAMSATAAFTSADARSSSLRRDAVATLNRTSSPEFRREFDRLSGTAHATRRNWERLVGERPTHEAAVVELETEAAQLESEFAVSERRNGSTPPDNIARARQGWRDRLGVIKEETAWHRAFGDTITAAYAEHKRAVAELERFTESESRNWRNLNFD